MPTTNSTPLPTAALRFLSRRRSARADPRVRLEAGEETGAPSARTARSTASPLKTRPRPAWAATAPMAGPTTIPIRAAPMAAPMTEPRRPGEVVLVSQASAPDHATAPPMPCTKRAVSRTTPAVPHPKPSVATMSSAKPANVVARTPKRSTIAIEGTAPRSTPAGYAATRTPTSVVVRWTSFTSRGMSGGTTA